MRAVSSSTTPSSPLSLREAVCLANNIGGAVTINIPSGTYNLTNGELQVGKAGGNDVTLSGAGQASTVISAGGLSRVLNLDPSVLGGVAVSISGVTVTGGAVTTFGGAGIIGGSGTAATADTLSISNTTLTNNSVNSATTNKPGGGLQFIGGSLTITNSTFSNNSSGSSPGSGVHYSARGTASGEQLTVSGTTFSGNNVNASAASITVGGALSTQIQAGSPAAFNVSNSRFVNNTVTGSGTGIPHGAGIFSQSGVLNVTGSTFTGNSVTGGSNPSGGAISVLGGVATAHYNRFTGNVGANGAGMFVGASATMDATDNWWGCNTGPGTAGCDSVGGTPTVSPRLVLTAAASPATVVGPNATANITASLTQDSAGSAVGSGNLGAFAALPVSWTDPQPAGATVSVGSSNISSGSAATTYNSHATTGPGHVLATLDSGTATASVTVNQAPAITSANTATFSQATAGSFTVTTTGYPAPAITETGALPSGMTFTDNGNGTATLSGTPTAGSSGTYALNLTAANGVSPNGTQTLTVTVGQPPTITSADHTTFAVGSAGSFAITTSGVPSATISRTGTFPAWLTLTDNGDGTGSLTGTPPAGSGGSYPFTLKAANGFTPAASQAFTLTINQPPAITSADHTTFTVGSAGSFTVTTSPGTPAATTITETGALPAGVTFTDNGDGTATLAGTPAAGTGGSYPLTITASNGVAPNATQAFTLTINQPPAITSADHTTFTVGSAGSFTVTTSPGTPAATTITETGALPAGVTFTDNGDGTATLAGTPAAGTGGSYPLTITASNGVAPNATQAFTLTINQPPAITSADHTTFTVGSAGSFTVTTSPGTPAATTITETGALPAGVTFTDNGDGTATLAGTPAAGTGGSYPLTITASNGVAPNATQAFTLTINQPPAITSADHTTFTVGSAGSFTVTTSPGTPAATTITETGALPAGVTFTDNGDGTATLAGTPAAGTGGSYPLTITASNGVAPNATQAFTLTINQPPAITSADHTTFTVGSAGSFTVTTSPGTPAATTITETGALPAGVTFTDNGDGTATLAGTPAAGTGGSYPLTITASNGVAPNATQAFTLTINQPPAITSTDHTTFTVGSAGSFTVTTSPGTPAATTITETGALPAGVSFTDNGDGTATLAGTPAAGTGGSYPLTLTAGNASGAKAAQSFTLTIGADVPPAATDVPPVASAGSGGLQVTVTASSLPQTGPAGDLRAPVGYGLAAILAGFFLVMANRRRRPRWH